MFRGQHKRKARLMNSKKTGFSLFGSILILIVLGLTAFCLYPRYVHAVADGRPSNLLSNLQSIRSQLELYRVHHNGAYPANITEGLTKKTDADGTINPTGQYGPYLYLFPGNPYILDDVEAVKTTGKFGEGWVYEPLSGVFSINENVPPRKPFSCCDSASLNFLGVNWVNGHLN